MLLASAPVRVLPPLEPVAGRDRPALPAWVIRAWEPRPPAGVEPLEWFLGSSLPGFFLLGW